MRAVDQRALGIQPEREALQRRRCRSSAPGARRGTRCSAPPGAARRRARAPGRRSRGTHHTSAARAAPSASARQRQQRRRAVRREAFEGGAAACAPSQRDLPDPGGLPVVAAPAALRACSANTPPSATTARSKRSAMPASTSTAAGQRACSRRHRRAEAAAQPLRLARRLGQPGAPAAAPRARRSSAPRPACGTPQLVGAQAHLGLGARQLASVRRLLRHMHLRGCGSAARGRPHAQALAAPARCPATAPACAGRAPRRCSAGRGVEHA